MRFREHHVADSTVARIMTAADRVSRGGAAALPTDSKPLPAPDQGGAKSPPAGLVEVAKKDDPTAAQAGSPADQAGSRTPPLDESGLDIGMVLQGRDSLDSLIGG